MNWLNRLPDSKQSEPGFEWTLWKRLPAILAWGTLLPLALAAVFWFVAPSVLGGVGAAGWWLMVYQIIGLVIFFWTLMLTLAIGCVIVMLMKGPAFVADAYPLPSRDSKA